VRVEQTGLLCDKEVGADDEHLAHDVANPDVVERVGVIERDPPGHWSVQRQNRAATRDRSEQKKRALE
jgi:hypothetical protein